MWQRSTFTSLVLLTHTFGLSIGINNQVHVETASSVPRINNQTDEGIKWYVAIKNETRILHASTSQDMKIQKRDNIHQSLKIRVAMKDESDTSLMEGDTVAVVYRITAYNYVVDHNFSLTFKVDNDVVNITNLNAENQIHVHINTITSYFTIFLKALRVGKTNVEITGIHELKNSSNTLTVGRPPEKLQDTEKFESSLTLEDRRWYDINNSTITVSVYYSTCLKRISEAMGWLYFLSWTLIFYPQIYGNWKSKSVVGFNFDFLAIVTVDLILYTTYNIGLFASPSIQREYKEKLNTEVIPVKINDVVFGIHAVCACLVMIAQCTCYKSGGQYVSKTCKIILGCIFVFIVAIMVTTLTTNALEWIDFLTYISFVKIFTVTKYIPQIYMNFRRKSTSGFSVGVIFCDFNGGLFSMGQMIAESYNFDDFSSFSGNPTKFIVGLFTLVSDIILIIQHYVCYRNTIPWEEIRSGDEDENYNNLTTPNI